MNIGTRSVLFGAHQFLLHPCFVYAAWVKLYGWTLDPRIIVACIVHDIGYVGKPNMDGEEGETHPEFGAKIMGALFDREASTGWYDFVLLHSRYYAKKRNMLFSRLCVADKLAICLTPWWLYLPLVNLSGEIKEYMAMAQVRANNNERLSDDEKNGLLGGSQRAWYKSLQDYMRRWVEEHKDGRVDKWTGSGVKADGVRL